MEKEAAAAGRPLTVPPGKAEKSSGFSWRHYKGKRVGRQ
jgi:hypothetical protein